MSGYSHTFIENDQVGNPTSPKLCRTSRLHKDRGQLNLDGTFSAEGGSASGGNPLNQLTDLSWGGKLDVYGNISDGTPPFTVSVNDEAAAIYNVTNFLGGARLQPGKNIITVVATDAANKKKKAVSTVTAPPMNPEQFTYDMNGNLVSDGWRTYTWDEENRLIAVETSPNVGAPRHVGMAWASAPRMKSEFLYDGMGRRVEKRVSTYTNDRWQVTSDHTFVYDGWNLISERTVTYPGVPRHTITGQININPNNSSQNEFTLTLPDGSTITRDDLTKDYAEYSGPATSIHVKPKGSGKQDGLIVDGASYELDNNKAYYISSEAMAVRLYNDRVDKKGKANGQWWIEIAATNATITPSNAEELRAPSSEFRTNYYVWGMDLSQSLQGAGGVGGLLAVVSYTNSLQPTVYYPVYDGNGNITDYVDTNGTVVAHREYDPFGRTVVSTGPMKDAFSFWFSIKYLEAFWNVYYFGHRWYSPNLHIWLSRDPIGEVGFQILGGMRHLPGINMNTGYHRLEASTSLLGNGRILSIFLPHLISAGKEYLFVQNDPIQNTDYLGLDMACKLRWDCICRFGSKTGVKQKYVATANGCGPEGLPPWIPNPDNPYNGPACSFLSACDAHDCCYAQCGSIKSACDNKIFNDLMAICASCTIPGSDDYLYCKDWAKVYWDWASNNPISQERYDASQADCEPCCCP